MSGDDGEGALRRQLIERAWAAVGEPEAAPPDPLGFLTSYYAHMPLDDLAAADAADLVGSALHHWRDALQRSPGETKLAVYVPSVAVNGWSSGHSVVQVVTDDKPFLVDSVTAALSELGRAISLVVHPVLQVERSDGELIGFSTNKGIAESWIHIDFDRETDPDELDAVAQVLMSVLADVDLAVGDWQNMRQSCLAAAAELGETQTGSMVAESVGFLQWLADGHFTFLGVRDYTLVDRPDGRYLVPEASSGLGILSPDGGRPLIERQLSGPALVSARDPEPLILTKANSKATVHRSAYLDYVGVKRYVDGNPVGERRFLGLYTAATYNDSVTRIPLVRAKVNEVLQRSQIPFESHNGKDLRQFLETYPRDQVFQASVEDLLAVGTSVLSLQERRRTRVFLRSDFFGRFESVLVYLPRDRYTTTVRRRVEDILLRVLNGHHIEFQTRVTESVLARLHFVVHAPPGGALQSVSPQEVEELVASAVRSWDDDFAAAAHDTLAAAEASLAIRTVAGVGETYKESFAARTAVADVHHLLGMAPEETHATLYSPYGSDSLHQRLKIYRQGSSVSLTHILPILTNLGVEVVDERPYKIARDDAPDLRIYDVGLLFPDGDIPHEGSLRARFQEAFLAVWNGQAESDAFNSLVVWAGLDWREVVVLRSIAKYQKQAGSSFSQTYVQQTLVDHWQLTRWVVDLFVYKFDPDLADRATQVEDLRAKIAEGIADITSMDVDRIFRFFVAVIEACTRTNFYAQEAGSFQLVLKLRPQEIPELPAPKPLHELWVHSPELDGVHLRFADVARGGLRWSDRPEDFRTEVLGLVKAQEIKNAVIVPAGAKGGFFVKSVLPSHPRQQRLEMGQRAYRNFIGGLLSVTDNRVDGEIVSPARVVCYDNNDSYLVVAADKGTASFSDLANDEAKLRGFWLGDAFASGGSEGYDHKKMGITARGAWESVKRHFRELGVDTQSQEFTVVGIGDMSGDVFGNGMLLSPHIRLVAAFDHRHIFIDPNPDAAAGFAERQRLFDFPGSSWDDYDRARISSGGGVFRRDVKAVPITDEIRAALGLRTDISSLTPPELVRAILRAPTDLLWNGGIGTYVKAQSESNLDVGDKANDLVRVDGCELKCRVVGEGGNLGLTQLGRIEAAQNSVLLNTDAVDNSAGVDTSDHEVNIKVLLDQRVAEGDMTEKQRNAALVEMTDDVADLVLANNYDQNLALGNARSQVVRMGSVHRRMLTEWERLGFVDRQLAGLPSDEELADRLSDGQGLTGSELCVLLSYAKISLTGSLVAHDFGEAAIVETMQRYFPALMHSWTPEMIDHPLRDGIVSTVTASELVDLGGLTFAFRVREETGADDTEVVAGFMFARDVFAIRALRDQIVALDNVVSTDIQSRMFTEVRRLLDRGTRWYLQRSPKEADSLLGDYRDRIARLAQTMPQMLVGAERARMDTLAAELRVGGVPPDLAQFVGGLVHQYGLLDIIEIATATGNTDLRTAQLYYMISERFEADELLTRISSLDRDQRWNALARQSLRSDLYAALGGLTKHVIAEMDAGDDVGGALDRWEETHQQTVARTLAPLREIASLRPPTIAALSVALRTLRSLVGAVTDPA